MKLLLYGSTTRNLMKRLEKRLEGDCAKTLRAVLIKSRKHHDVQSYISHLKKHPNKTNTTRQGEQVRDVFVEFPTNGHRSEDLPIKSYFLLLSTNTSHCLEDIVRWLIETDNKRVSIECHIVNKNCWWWRPCNTSFTGSLIVGVTKDTGNLGNRNILGILSVVHTTFENDNEGKDL